MTGEAFRAYVEQVLAPELEPGDAVVMDNLSVHKVAGVREAIQAAGASVLYLSSYSPDFNPIEQLFAKFKALLRKAAARTQSALWETIGTLLDDFTPGECQNYMANSGYEFVYSTFRSSCIVSCGSEVVGAFGGREDVDEAPDGGPKALDGSLRGFAQQCFQFGEGVLDRVKIRAVRREIEQACARRLDQGSHACPLVAGQVVQDHD